MRTTIDSSPILMNTGATVDITGQLLGGPEQSGDEVAIQMWADPINIDWNTIVRTDETALDLRGDDYVRVQGTVTGSFEGENAFDGMITAVEVEADDISKVPAVEAVDPTNSIIEVNQTLEIDGFSVMINRVEIADRVTRVYLTTSNQGERVARLDSYRANLTQGGKRISQKDVFEYSLPEPRGATRPGEDNDGALSFGAVNGSQPFEVNIPWSSGGYMADDPDPFVFAIDPE